MFKNYIWYPDIMTIAFLIRSRLVFILTSILARPFQKPLNFVNLLDIRHCTLLICLDYGTIIHHITNIIFGCIISIYLNTVGCNAN